MRIHRTCGSDGDGGGPGRGRARGRILFPSARPVLLEPQLLQNGKAQQGARGVMQEPTPCASFAVIEPECVLELLMRLFTPRGPSTEGIYAET
jgi:hypothetical protein